jgi:hypothetical protein
MPKGFLLDGDDPATAACLAPGRCYSDYTRFLNKRALRHARIAVPRVYWNGFTPAQQTRYPFRGPALTAWY